MKRVEGIAVAASTRRKRRAYEKTKPRKRGSIRSHKGTRLLRAAPQTAIRQGGEAP